MTEQTSLSRGDRYTRRERAAWQSEKLMANLGYPGIGRLLNLELLSYRDVTFEVSPTWERAIDEIVEA